MLTATPWMKSDPSPTIYAYKWTDLLQPNEYRDCQPYKHNPGRLHKPQNLCEKFCFLMSF